MKYFINLLVVFQLSILFSCGNDSLLNDDSNLLSLEMGNDSIQTLRYCYNCLPMITAYHDPGFNELVIAWSGYSENPVQHPVTISYKVDGFSGSKRIESANGEIRQKVYTGTYIARWSVKCGAYSCLSCNKSESILKKESGGTEVSNYNACYKDYLTYSVEKVYNFSNTYDLILRNSADLNNTEKYITIDNIKVYKVDKGTGFELEIYNALSLDMSSAPYRIRLFLSNQEMDQSFRIKFFSSRCENNSAHYLYTNYYFDGQGARLSSYLNLAKNH